MADSFRVVSQQQGYALSTDGKTEKVMDITFVAEPAGVQSQLQVPMDRYNVDDVRTQLEAAAETINAVHAL
jgi:hypothetical protein